MYCGLGKFIYFDSQLPIMKYIYLLLTLCMLTSIVGVASAGNRTIDNPMDIIDKGKVLKSASDSWDNGLSGPGYLVIGIILVFAVAVIIIGILLGTAKKTIGKLSGNNDDYDRGSEMMSTSVLSAVMIIIAFVILGLAFSMW